MVTVAFLVVVMCAAIVPPVVISKTSGTLVVAIDVVPVVVRFVIAVVAMAAARVGIKKENGGIFALVSFAN